MRRRDVLSAFGGAAAMLAPLPVASQQSRSKQPRIGVLLYTTPEGDPNLGSFLGVLREFGYVEGENIKIDYRFAEGRPERLPGLAAELIGLKPDLLFGLGGDVTGPIASATKTIPILFGSSADPVKLGFVASLARPGGNATGVTFLLDDLASKRLEFLKEAVPALNSVSFIWNPDHSDNELAEAERAAKKLSLALTRIPMRGPNDLEGSLRAVQAAQSGAMYVVSSRQTVREMPHFIRFTAAEQIPLAGGWGAWARAGALLSYGPNLSDMMRQAARYAERILQGAKPADLPVQQPTRFELIINLKTAKSLSLEISHNLLAQADELIE